MEYCNGILNSRFCSYPLDRLYYDTFRFLVSSQFRIIHDVVDIGLGLCFSFLFQWFHQAFFSLFGGQSGDCFQLLDFLLLQFVKFFFFLVYNDKLRFQILFDSFGFHLLALNFFLALSEYHFALFQLVFRLLNLLISECYLFFKICFLVQEFLLHFQQLVLLNYFRFRLCLFQDIVVFGL